MESVDTKKAFAIASGVHVAFFGIIALAILWKFIKREPEPLLFELVSIANSEVVVPEAPDMQVSEVPQSNEVELTAPEIADLDSTQPIDVRPPQVVEPPPQPVKPKVEKIKPPEPKQTETIKPKENVEPEPQPKKISAKDFFKQQGKPTPAQPRQTTAKRNVRSYQLDTSSIARLKDMMPQRSANLSASSQAALMTYISGLRQKISIAWNKPSSLNTDELTAIVRFTVLPSGQVTRVSLSQSSGQRLFDNSVLLAVKSARGVSGPPSGKAEEFRLPFSLK